MKQPKHRASVAADSAGNRNPREWEKALRKCLQVGPEVSDSVSKMLAFLDDMKSLLDRRVSFFPTAEQTWPLGISLFEALSLHPFDRFDKRVHKISLHIDLLGVEEIYRGRIWCMLKCP